MVTTYDKDGAYIEVTEDGVTYRRSIKWEDCVVSVPGGSNQKIDSVYLNESNQLILVLEDETEITLSDIIDHGNLIGLTDDDHKHYVLATGARAMNELRLTPKASSSGPEGTMYYDSGDDSVYVGTEA